MEISGKVDRQRGMFDHAQNNCESSRPSQYPAACCFACSLNICDAACQTVLQPQACVLSTTSGCQSRGECLAVAGMQEDEEVGGEGAWGDLVQPRYRRMMVLAVSLPLLQQASGINSITFYSSSVSPHSQSNATCGQPMPSLSVCRPKSLQSSSQAQPLCFYL